jgi:hypothetical protein
MTCPHCQADIQYDDVHRAFTDNDYATYFDWLCPHCEGDIHVNVHACPDFELNDPAHVI